MTSPPQSDQNADELNAAFKDLKLWGISPTDPNGERHDQYPVSTNPCGFSFIGHFLVELGIANQTVEKNATDTFTHTSTDAAKITDSHVSEIDKTQEEVAYQKAVKECFPVTPIHEKLLISLWYYRRREKYLSSYGHFLPIKQVPHAGEVSPKETRERSRSPSGVRTNDVEGTKSGKEIASDDQLK
ncbi:hypothetical protein B9Z19DRAFT_1063147 [Tuber borchii]|uniref:Uncharacterized protein n=1 Tax=Tuber borchii TaxID=42251 RepID=A0A2T6ZZ85_TUBBO|nr:hypothetical protein B9Z19DRAFT_1063147 [Tuber borchii]